MLFIRLRFRNCNSYWPGGLRIDDSDEYFRVAHPGEWLTRKPRSRVPHPSLSTVRVSPGPRSAGRLNSAGRFLSAISMRTKRSAKHKPLL
jgi:hypothetical protein